MADLSGFTTDMLIQAHKLTAVPSVMIEYVAMMLTLFICGLFIARRSGKFWSIFFLTAVVGAIVAFGIATMPNVVQAIADLFARTTA